MRNSLQTSLSLIGSGRSDELESTFFFVLTFILESTGNKKRPLLDQLHDGGFAQRYLLLNAYALKCSCRVITNAKIVKIRNNWPAIILNKIEWF